MMGENVVVRVILTDKRLTWRRAGEGMRGVERERKKRKKNFSKKIFSKKKGNNLGGI